MKTPIFLLALLGLLPAAPLPATAAPSAIEATLDRATVWRTRSKLGRIRAQGTLRATGGPLDETRITVVVTDGQDLQESGEFTSCRTFASGTVRCSNADRTSRIRYIPDRTDPDLYRYKLDLRRRDITRPQVPPLRISFQYDGTLEGAAQNEPCRVLNAKIVCKGQSMACTAEVCDGLDNDCDGTPDDGLGQTTCGLGACETTVDSCVGGVPQTCTPGTPGAPICEAGQDNDCDGTPDLDQAACAVCPQTCADAIAQFAAHDFTNHDRSSDCGYDQGRMAGFVSLDTSVGGQLSHDDRLAVTGGRCLVVVADTPVANAVISSAAQAACAPLAAAVVTDVLRLPCDISPP